MIQLCAAPNPSWEERQYWVEKDQYYDWHAREPAHKCHIELNICGRIDPGFAAPWLLDMINGTSTPPSPMNAAKDFFRKYISKTDMNGRIFETYMDPSTTCGLPM